MSVNARSEDRFAVEVVGAEAVEVAPNYAKTKLTIEPRHFNAVGLVQGGVYFTLADYAFALASNNENETVVAIEVSISYVKPTQGGVLYAEATLLSRSKSLVAYDIPVRNEHGELVARFYGRGFVRQPHGVTTHLSPGEG